MNEKYRLPPSSFFDLAYVEVRNAMDELRDNKPVDSYLTLQKVKELLEKGMKELRP